ncbi:MAG: hypothetical protein MI974_13400 [Chitinophagales bacterium]|nr:hypothetical protein [Chitinophagales bacterium]
MFIRIVELLLLIFLAFSCQQPIKQKSDCQQFFVQREVLRLGIGDLYKEALWQVYKFNLVEGDSFAVKNPFYIDSTHTEKSLSEFDLELDILEQKGDTTSFALFFKKGVSPVGHEYYCSVSFWGDEKMEIGDRYLFTTQRDMYEPEFKEYLWKNKDKLSPMLNCLAKERSIFTLPDE